MRILTSIHAELGRAEAYLLSGNSKWLYPLTCASAGLAQLPDGIDRSDRAWAFEEYDRVFKMAQKSLDK